MLDAYRDLIDELLDSPNVIRAAIEGQDAAGVSGEALHLVAWLLDRDRVVLDRVQAMTRQDAPYLQALVDEQPPFQGESAALLREMETARGELVSLLINLSLKDWERRAIHETEGDISLVDEVERHVEFDEGVRRQLREWTT